MKYGKSLILSFAALWLGVVTALLSPITVSAATPTLPACDLSGWDWQQAYTSNGGIIPIEGDTVFSIFEVYGFYLIAIGMPDLTFTSSSDGENDYVNALTSNAYQQIYDPSSKAFVQEFTGSGSFPQISCVSYANNVVYDPSFTAPHYPTYPTGGGGGSASILPDDTVPKVTESLQQTLASNGLAIAGLIAVTVALLFIIRWFTKSSDLGKSSNQIWADYVKRRGK